MKISLSLSACFFMLFLSACGGLTQSIFESGLVQKPTITVNSVAVRQLSLSNAGVDVILSLNNPNAFGFNVQGVDYRLSINGYEFVAGEQQQGMSIAAHQVSEIAVPIDIKFAQLKQLFSSMNQLSTLEYQLHTKTYVKLPGAGVVPIASNYDGTWKLSDILRLPLP